jgi:cation transport ATPase
MGWLKDFFTSSTSSVVDSIGKAIDDNVTSDEERLTLHNELAKINTEAQSKADDVELKLESELSKRHETDMQSDNALSKNIRPMALIYLLGIVSLLAATDGNIGSFTVGEKYITLFQALLTVAFGFYYGSRGLEKIMKIFKGSKG